MLFIAEVSINFYYVGVVEKTLNFELSYKLDEEVLFYYLGLLNYLQADHHASQNLLS
jgi:hypothetical protein